MDIRCRFCGEPWDMDELHYVDARDLKALDYSKIPFRVEARTVVDLGTGYPEEAREEAYPMFDFAYAAFRKHGCLVFGPSSSCMEARKGEGADPRIGTTLDALGNDADGAAAVLEDLGG